MIYITGDTHGQLNRFDDAKIRRLKKGDSLIICGDFGFLWDGGKAEERRLKALGKKKYNILFLDGAHENFDSLDRYPVTDWNGGKVQNISGNLYHLMRGQVYELEGKKIFAFGGGESLERQMRIDAGKWWSREMPTREEMQEGVNNLRNHNMEVDYIVTYEPSPRMRMLNKTGNEISPMETYFEGILKSVKFQKWFFGSLHLDRMVTASHYAVFNGVNGANLPNGRNT